MDCSMRRKLLFLFLGLVMAGVYSCSDDGFPVPPASTVPKFSTEISNDGFAPATVTFTNETIVPDRAGEVAYTWSFGDGNSSAEKNPVHLYDMPGAFEVTLVAITSKSFEIKEKKETIVIKDSQASGIPVFFSDGSSVFTAFINVQTPVPSSISITGLQNCYGMTVDTVNSKLYIADFDGERIIVSDLDGGNQQDFRTGIGPPSGITIDYEMKRLYWDTDNGIRFADMTNSTLNEFQDFVTGQSNDPEGTTIDAVNRVLFWNNYNGGVWRKNLDGTGEAEIVPGGQGGGSILVIGTRIFFDEYIASGDIYLKSANFDGSGIATVATGISRVVYGIAYDKDSDKVYWVDRNNDVIMRSNLDGSNPEPWYTGASARGLVFGKKKE